MGHTLFQQEILLKSFILENFFYISEKKYLKEQNYTVVLLGKYNYFEIFQNIFPC